MSDCRLNYEARRSFEQLKEQLPAPSEQLPAPFTMPFESYTKIFEKYHNTKSPPRSQTTGDLNKIMKKLQIFREGVPALTEFVIALVHILNDGVSPTLLSTEYLKTNYCLREKFFDENTDEQNKQFSHYVSYSNETLKIVNPVKHMKLICNVARLLSGYQKEAVTGGGTETIETATKLRVFEVQTKMFRPKTIAESRRKQLNRKRKIDYIDVVSEDIILEALERKRAPARTRAPARVRTQTPALVPAPALSRAPARKKAPTRARAPIPIPVPVPPPVLPLVPPPVPPPVLAPVPPPVLAPVPLPVPVSVPVSVPPPVLAAAPAPAPAGELLDYLAPVLEAFPTFEPTGKFEETDNLVCIFKPNEICSSGGSGSSSCGAAFVEQMGVKRSYSFSLFFSALD